MPETFTNPRKGGLFRGSVGAACLLARRNVRVAVLRSEEGQGHAAGRRESLAQQGGGVQGKTPRTKGLKCKHTALRGDEPKHGTPMLRRRLPAQGGSLEILRENRPPY